MNFKSYVEKRSRLVFFWIVSYLSILVIPLIISSYVYTQSVRYIEDETNRAHLASLQQLQQTMDSRLGDIQKLSILVSLNEKVNGLMNTKGSLESYHRYSMIDIIKEFKTYNVANAFISDFYVYFKHNDFILSSVGLFEAKEYFDRYYQQYEGLSFEQWMEMQRKWQVNNYIPFKNKNQNNIESYTIMFMRSLPILTVEEAAATLVISMDRAMIQQAIQGLKGLYDGIVMIVDKNDEVIALSGESDLDLMLTYKYLDDNKSVFRTLINSEEVVISYIQSNETDWKYVSVVPSKVFMYKVQHVKKLIIISVILCFIIGGWVAYYFAKKNYYPINKIAHILKEKLDLPAGRQKNEYNIIENSILKVLQDKEKDNERLSQQDVVMKNSFLSRLLRGKILSDSVSFKVICQNYSIQFDNNLFIVILFYIDDSSNLFFENKLEESEDNDKMAHFIIKNIVEELTNQKHKGYIFETEDTLVCLANVSKNEENVLEDIFNLICESKDFINKNFGISFSASISNIHSEFSGIPIAYQEALEALEYKIIMDDKQVIRYSDIQSSQQDELRSVCSLETQQQFLNCIKVGDLRKAREIVEGIFYLGDSDKPLSVDMAKCLMFTLINTMLNAVVELRAVCDISFIKELNSVRRLLDCESIMEMKYHINDMLINIDKYILSSVISDDNKFDDIIDFVDKNYSDINLSVSMIANIMSMNAPYISRYFRSKSGQGLLDYINRIRLKKAKEILGREDSNIKEIATQVGYCNCNTFIRVFRRYEGITPGQFREIILKYEAVTSKK